MNIKLRSPFRNPFVTDLTPLEQQVDDAVSKVSSEKESAKKQLKETIDDFEKEAEKLKRDLAFWHSQFRKYSFTQCLHCKEKLMLWPYAKTAYYQMDTGHVHHACYDEYLNRDNSEL